MWARTGGRMHKCMVHKFRQGDPLHCSLPSTYARDCEHAQFCARTSYRLAPKGANLRGLQCAPLPASTLKIRLVHPLLRNEANVTLKHSNALLLAQKNHDGGPLKDQRLARKSGPNYQVLKGSARPAQERMPGWTSVPSCPALANTEN